MDSYLVELLDKRKMPASIRELGLLDCSITAEENKSPRKSQWERTSGEPSALGFAHYKTASMDSELNEIDTMLHLVPLILGLTPAAWKLFIDVEILKRADEYKVAKMRLIQLMSPEFQINNKIFGQHVLAHAEKAAKYLSTNTAAKRITRQSTHVLTKY